MVIITIEKNGHSAELDGKGNARMVSTLKGLDAQSLSEYAEFITAVATTAKEQNAKS
jgi:hypothetical protein